MWYYIYTDLNISVADNNLEDMKTQRLIIYGPYNDYIRIYDYKDGSDNGILANYNSSDKTYYMEFDQSSRGVYSFEIFSTEIELAKIVDKVYVVNKLEDFLIMKVYLLVYIQIMIKIHQKKLVIVFQ